MNKVGVLWKRFLINAKKEIKHIGWLGFLVLLICMAVTVYVGYKTARVQSFNNDSIITNLMVADPSKIPQAVFLDDHSFMMKWPLLIVSDVFMSSFQVYLSSTVILYATTVFGFIATIYWLSKRNVKFTSLLSLLMTSTLSLVPIQPGGNLLPVNMAMISTRNLEIIFFLAFILFIANWAHSLRRRYLYAAAAALFAVGISDGLFLYIAITTGVIMSLIHVWKVRRAKVTDAAHKLLFVSVLTYLLVTVTKYTLALIGATSFFKMGVPTSTRGSLFAYMQAAIDSVQASLESFGATVFNVALGPRFLLATIALLIFIAGSMCIWRISKQWVSAKPERNESRLDTRTIFIRILIVSFVAHELIYVFLAPIPLRDARFLCLVTITIFATLSYCLSVGYTWNKKINMRNSLLLVTAAALVLFSTAVFRQDANTLYAYNQQRYGTNIDALSQAVKDNKIDVALTRFYAFGPVAIRTPDAQIAPLAESGACIFKKSDYLAVEDWYSPKVGRKTALMMIADGEEAGSGYNNSCNQEYYEKKLGTPKKEVDVNGPLHAKIFIYDYDIRERLDGYPDRLRGE